MLHKNINVHSIFCYLYLFNFAYINIATIPVAAPINTAPSQEFRKFFVCWAFDAIWGPSIMSFANSALWSTCCKKKLSVSVSYAKILTFNPDDHTCK